MLYLLVKALFWQVSFLWMPVYAKIAQECYNHLLIKQDESSIVPPSNVFLRDKFLFKIQNEAQYKRRTGENLLEFLCRNPILRTMVEAVGVGTSWNCMVHIAYYIVHVSCDSNCEYCLQHIPQQPRNSSGYQLRIAALYVQMLLFVVCCLLLCSSGKIAC